MKCCDMNEAFKVTSCQMPTIFWILSKFSNFFSSIRIFRLLSQIFPPGRVETCPTLNQNIKTHFSWHLRHTLLDTAPTLLRCNDTRVHPSHRIDPTQKCVQMTSAQVRTPADLVSHLSQDGSRATCGSEDADVFRASCSNRSIFLRPSVCSSWIASDPLALTSFGVLVWAAHRRIRLQRSFALAFRCSRIVEHGLLNAFTAPLTWMSFFSFRVGSLWCDRQMHVEPPPAHHLYTPVPQAHPLHFSQFELFSFLGLAFSQRLCPCMFPSWLLSPI